MAALSGGEDGRKEKTKSLPPPPDRTAQRQWRNLIGRWKKPKEKIFSQEREESFSGRLPMCLLMLKLGSSAVPITNTVDHSPRMQQEWEC
jgi:hypothetical protein